MDGNRSLTLAERVRHYAQERGKKVAFICGDRRTTFEQFDKATSRVANGLIAAGVTAQRRFAYLCRNSDYVFELFYGGHKADAVAVGVNWRLTAQEAAYILNDAGALLIFTDGPSLPLARAAAALAPCVSQIILFDADASEIPLPAGTVNYVAWRDALYSTDPRRDRDRDQVACQLYTSGTTGHPKGVLLTHRNFIEQRRSGRDTGPWMNAEEGAIVLAVMPLYHVGGLTMGTTGFAQGATVIVSASTDPEGLMDIIEREAVTQTFLVPAVIQALLDHPACRPERLQSLRYVRYGAAPITAALLRQARAMLSCGFIQAYGMTEATGAATSLPPDQHVDAEVDRRMRSVGKPLAHIALTIRDEDGRELPPGAVGEVCIRAGSVTAGYWNLPNDTAAAFHGDWYRTGDAGSIDEAGYVYLKDRLKDLIISGGENIYPAEVENILCDHPDIAEAAVIGVPDRRWGEAVKAVVVARPGVTLSKEDLDIFLRDRVAAYKAPKSIDFVESLPRNSSGKILRRELRASLRITTYIDNN